MTGQITQDPPWSFLALGPGRRQKAAARAPGPQTRPRRASGLRPTHTGHTRAQPPRGHNDRQTPLHRAQGRRRPPDRAQGLRLWPPQPHGPLRAETWPETWCRRGRPRPGPSRAAGDAGFGARRGGARVSVGCACVCGSLWPESSRREGLRSQRQGQEAPRGDALLRGTPASPGPAAGAAQYATFQWVGCSHCSSWSPQKRLYVVRGSKPRISLSSWIRKENVETDVPMKNLPSSTTVTCPRDEPPAARRPPGVGPGRPATVTRAEWPWLAERIRS